MSRLYSNLLRKITIKRYPVNYNKNNYVMWENNTMGWQSVDGLVLHGIYYVQPPS